MLTTSSLSPGTQSIVAQYSGDANNTPSVSAPLNENVIPIMASTTTTVVSSAKPSMFNQLVAFTATVVSSGAPPTGSVTFYDGATMLATVALTGSDTASYSTSTLAVGGHPVTAVYSGDANDVGSTSSVLNQVVNPDSTHVALTVSNTTPVVGQKVTLKATVTVLPPGTGTATGSVTFYEGSTALGTATLASGVASLLVPFTTAGPGSVTAVYSGNATDATSTSAGVSVSVGVDTTKTVLAVTPAAPVVGQTVTLKATVSVVAPGVGTPTGSVTFYDAGTSIGTVALTGTTASLPMTYASPGSHSFTAVYSGDTNDNTLHVRGLGRHGQPRQDQDGRDVQRDACGVRPVGDAHGHGVGGGAGGRHAEQLGLGGVLGRAPERRNGPRSRDVDRRRRVDTHHKQPRGRHAPDPGGLRRRSERHHEHVDGGQPGGQEGCDDHGAEFIGQPVGVWPVGHLHGDGDGDVPRLSALRRER